MRRWNRSLCGMAAFTLIIWGAGCVYTEQTKTAPPVVTKFKGELRVASSLSERPPQNVAVLPFLNRTEKKEAFDIVRKSFHGHFSKLNYTTMPLFKVDDASLSLAMTLLPTFYEIINYKSWLEAPETGAFQGRKP